VADAAKAYWRRYLLVPPLYQAKISDVPLAIEEEHPQQLAGCAQKMD
jgi:hypothetical protein